MDHRTCSGLAAGECTPNEGSAEEATIEVAFVSQFFPHYRRALFSELNARGRVRMTLVGGLTDYLPSGIPPLDPNDHGRFVEAPCIRLPLGLMWQWRAVRFAAGTRVPVVVLTGDVHHLATWVAATILRVRGRVVLFWTHGWNVRDSGVARRLRSLFYRLADGLLLYGEYGKKLGTRQGFPRERLHVIHNSMGQTLLAAEDRTRDRSKLQKWITVSRLLPERRFDALIAQVAALRAEGRKVELTLVGDGPMKRTLEQQCERLGIDADFRGALYSEEVSRLLSESDVAIFPGNVGLSAIHAMSCGCPVVTHGDASLQMPEYEAIVDGITGALFAVDDYRDMAEKAWRFVQNSDHRVVSIACHEVVTTHWSATAQAAAMEKAVLEHLSQRKRGLNSV